MAVTGVWFCGCTIDSGENFEFVSLTITNVELPESFTFNSTHDIAVTYERPDTCTFFEGFDVSNENESTRNVVAIGTVLTTGACTTAIDEVTAVLSFTVLQRETYLFRFYAGDDANGNPQFIEHRIPVDLQEFNTSQ